MPSGLKTLQDKIVFSGIIMLIFIGTIMLLIGPSAIKGMKGLPGKNWVTRIILTILAFPVALSLIMLGVKMFVTEIQTLFEGTKITS